MIHNRAAFSFPLILAVAAGIIIGYAFFGLDTSAPLVIAVTVTAAPEPTVTDAVPTPTIAPTEVAAIRFLPDCTEPDTPSGSLCVYGTIAYPTCDPEAPISREPCYKP